MDPNANLREQRSLVREIIALNDRAADAQGLHLAALHEQLAERGARLAELVDALDHWLVVGGGALPNDWEGRV